MDRDKLLATTALFRGSKPEEIAAMLGCLGMRTRKYRAGERIHRMGDVISTVGLVLEGAVRIESVSVWGDVSVIGTAGPGQMFGEAYAAVPDEPLMVDVVAAGACEVMFLEGAKVLATCPHACPHHARASANLTAAIARRINDVPLTRESVKRVKLWAVELNQQLDLLATLLIYDA